MIAEKPKQISVSLEANLFEVAEPYVVLLSRNAGKGKVHYMGTAIPDDDGEIDYYYCTYVSTKILKKYFEEQCDLRYVFEFAPGRKFYTAKTIPHTKAANAVLVECPGDPTEEKLPEPRFFASAHTSDYGLGAMVGVDQRLLIDGNWDMNEFGAFYQRFSELYSYEQAIQYIADQKDNLVSKVFSAFARKPFKGASSYTGFFSDLFDIIPYRERPALEGIEYHSPGHVDLRGNEDVLVAVKHQLESFLDNLSQIQEAHDHLRKFMSDQKLLAIGGRNVELDEENSAKFRQLSDGFFDILPVNGKQHLLELTKGDKIVKAKVGLGLFRRLKSTAYFFAQGRLAYDEAHSRKLDAVDVFQ